MRPNRRLLAGGWLVLLLLAPAALSFFWTPHATDIIDIEQRLLPPGDAYLLGSDHLGRDMLSMLMLGLRTSVVVAALAVAIGMLVGVPLGLLAALRRGSSLDLLIVRTNDLIFAFPVLVVAVLFAAVFGPSLSKAMLAIGIFNIPVFARLVRSSALSIWSRDFILAAQVAGKGRVRISFEHILPNLTDLLIAQGTTQFALGVLSESGLSYLGLGAQPPLPSLGRIMAEGQTLISLAPWIAISPGVVIVLLVLGCNFLGDGLRDALGPTAGD